MLGCWVTVPMRTLTPSKHAVNRDKATAQHSIANHLCAACDCDNLLVLPDLTAFGNRRLDMPRIWHPYLLIGMTNTQLEKANRNAADTTHAQQALYLTGLRRGLLGHLYIFFCSKLQLMTGCDMSAGVIFGVMGVQNASKEVAAKCRQLLQVLGSCSHERTGRLQSTISGTDR